MNNKNRKYDECNTSRSQTSTIGDRPLSHGILSPQAKVQIDLCNLEV